MLFSKTSIVVPILYPFHAILSTRGAAAGCLFQNIPPYGQPEVAGSSPATSSKNSLIFRKIKEFLQSFLANLLSLSYGSYGRIKLIRPLSPINQHLLSVLHNLAALHALIPLLRRNSLVGDVDGLYNRLIYPGSVTVAAISSSLFAISEKSQSKSSVLTLIRFPLIW